MKRSVLSSLQAEVYFSLLRRMLPKTSGLAICDPSGNPVWSDHEGITEQRFAATLEQLNQDSPEWTYLPVDSGSFNLTASCTVSICRLTMSADRPIGLLVAVHAPVATDAGQSSIDESLRHMATCIHRELSLTEELDAMAEELSERYEELNLVYHTEDKVNFFAEGQDALQQLVANCNEFLDIGLAALIFKDKSICLYSNSSDAPIPDSHLILASLREAMYERCTAENEPIVVNDMSSVQANQLCPGVPYKVIACPVSDSKSHADGVLVAVNHYYRADFSNSDKNLMTVMARKASKIMQANYDALTGLLGRSGFEHFLESYLGGCRAHNTTHCVLYLNLDDMHIVNDTISLQAGDELIKTAARTIKDVLRDTDIVAHLEGDVMAALLENCTLDQGARIAENLRHKISALSLEWEDQRIQVTASTGVVPLNAVSDSGTAALTSAEVACGAAKDNGKNRIQVFDAGDNNLVERRHQMEMVSRLQATLRENRFVLFAQTIDPIVSPDLSPHFEILIRMLDDQDTPMPPAMFLPAAERYHLMPAIDRWVLQHSLDALAAFRNGRGFDSGVCSINLSGQSLNDAAFLDDAIALIDESPITPERLCFEITETAAIANIRRAQHLISTLREKGCRFSLDDFGSGLSSFNYLKSLQVDFLKIDGGIVKDIVNDEISLSMVRAITEVGHTMGLSMIAEFVENDDIRLKLQTLGVDFGQGYGIARPIPLSDFLIRLGHSRKQVRAG